MAGHTLYQRLLTLRAQQQKAFAVLIDPDNVSLPDIVQLATLCNDAKVDFVLMGGSLMLSQHLDECIKVFKKHSRIPVMLFPGSPEQLSPYADALLYLSLISGRNPELLIGAHVVSAPKVKASGLEVISTGYMVIDGGVPTTVSYMSNSAPIPANKNGIALCTALAGEMLGMKVIYMDAGSGAQRPISESMIRTVSEQINIPMIVGGGITDPEMAYRACCAGADMIVVGNAIEKNPGLIREMADAVHQAGEKTVTI
jgi:putative glycerol-1-phosphate prenyltransferase